MFRTIVLVVFIGFVWIIQSQYSAAQNQNSGNTQQANTQSESRVIQTGSVQTRNQWSDPMVILTIFLIAGVLIQSAIYTWQAILMRRSVNQTREFFEMTERPIIVVEEVATRPALCVEHPMQPTIRICNKGRTAAQEIAISIQFAKPGDLCVLYPRDDQIFLKIPFLPAGDSEGVITTNQITLDFETHGAIANGKKSFFIHGEGRYQNLKGKPYVLEPYAFRFDPRQGWVPDWEAIAIMDVGNESEDSDSNYQNPN